MEPSDDDTFDTLFLRDVAHLKKMFIYMCQQCTALEDPISNVACQFLSGRMHVSFGISGLALFEDGIIYPYFYMSKPQRRLLYKIAGPIACDKPCSQRYRFCNGCVILTDYSGKTLDQRLVWQMVLQCVAASSKHQDCLRLLAKVVVQRVLCRVAHSKDMVSYVCQLTDEVFPPSVEERQDGDGVEWVDV
jgi:hypothetical protein